MCAEYHRLLLLFVDGVGLSAASPHNPFQTCPTPGLRSLLEGPLALETCQSRPELLLAPVDACLGVDGLPQSATGQAALFTGVNVARVLGRHITGLPGPRVRQLVERDNLLRRAVSAGNRCTFANAYTDAYLEAVERGDRRPSITTCMVSSGGLRFRGLKDLERHRAVSWDIVRDRLAEVVACPLESVSAAQAGRHLAGLAAEHTLTLYETFLTDMAGHRRLGFTPEEAVERIDGFIAGVVENRSAETTIVLTSDHGNLEESDHRRHTRNPVPLLVVGPLASEFARVDSILEVTPLILEILGADRYRSD